MVQRLGVRGQPEHDVIRRSLANFDDDRARQLDTEGVRDGFAWIGEESLSKLRILRCPCAHECLKVLNRQHVIPRHWASPSLQLELIVSNPAPVPAPPNQYYGIARSSVKAFDGRLGSRYGPRPPISVGLN
jgi:hypothetical protein